MYLHFNNSTKILNQSKDEFIIDGAW